MAKLDSGTVIWDKSPAGFPDARWLDSLVVGSGTVGASMTGAVANESILINHIALRDGGKTTALQDVSDKFPQIRKFYADGKILDAEAVLAREFEKKGYNPQMDYQIPVCTLKLNFTGDGFPLNYRRILDMESAEATVTFNEQERKLFVARNSDIVVFNAKGKVNLTVSVEGARHEGNWIYFSAKTSNGDDYGLVTRLVVSGGIVAARPEGVVVEAADSVMILAKPYIGSDETKVKKELEAIKLTYAKLHAPSEAIHKRLFNKVRLEFGEKTTDSQSMLMNFAREGVLTSTLLERLWNFAKYLSICTDGLSPSGLWLGEGKSVNYSMWNNAAQLLYGGIGLAVNPDSVLELLGSYEKFADDLRKNASRVFGMTGFFVPDKTAPGSALFGSACGSTLHFVASSALAANLFYRYYLVTGDAKVLKSRIYPFMQSVAEFYGDFLKLDANGTYSTMPSYSPNSIPGNTIQGKRLENFHFATNSTIDFLAVGALLDNLIHAGEALGDDDNIQLWTEMKGKLPRLQANESGGIREWTNSAFVDARVASGNLQNYGLYPLKTLSFNDYEVAYQPKVSVGANPKISMRQASINSISQRLNLAGFVQDAKTLGMYAAQMAHSQDSELAREMILKLLSSTFTNSGLSLSNDWRGGGFSLNAKPTLDICGNFGLAAAVTECLIQSNFNTLRILPSAFEEMAIGEATDLATDFGARISMMWNLNNSRLVLKITPKHNVTIDIHFHPAFKKTKNKERLEDGVMRKVQLVAGKTTVIEF
ncbi:MAG: glycoside hydrolase family 95 protein [Firmicutes bacterium]|nr:glycoside hydrolase family 95 protein [Bacillota bacterium]